MRPGALAALALLLAACGSGGGRSPAVTSTTSTPTSTTAPVSGTPVGSVDPVLEDLTQDAGAARQEVDAATCRALLPAGGSGECGDAGALTWVVSDGTGAARFVRVYRRDGEAHHAVAVAEDPDGARWSSARVLAVGSSLAVGFRDPGTGQFLVVDVVDPSGAIGASVRLDHGRAAVSGDRLETWSARFGPDDPNCCPGAWVHQVLAHGPEGWVVASEDQVDTAPAGDFP